MSSLCVRERGIILAASTNLCPDLSELTKVFGLRVTSRVCSRTMSTSCENEMCQTEEMAPLQVFLCKEKLQKF